MRPVAPPPFLRHHALQSPPPRGRRLSHRQRMMLGGIVSVVVFALFAALAIVLAHPERWHRPASPAAAATETSTTVTQKAPGVAEIEVQRGGGKQTYRLRQVGKQVVVEHASPPESARKGWWARQWDRLRGR